jgi:hypothetical protein
MTQIKNAQALRDEKIQAVEDVIAEATARVITRHCLHHELAEEIQKVAKEHSMEDEFRELAGPARHD